MKPNKVSYVRKPLAVRSYMAIGLSAAALILFVIGAIWGVRSQGNAALNVAAVCFCSLLTALIGGWYALISFLEREKNYILAKIGGSICAVLVIIWLVLIIIGLRG